MLGLWIRVLLGASLGIMMTQWPYPHECGWLLAGYLASVGTVVLGGAWIAFMSWRLRSGPAHLLALLLVYWGLVLAAEETFPRVGEPAARAGWQCARTGR